MLWTKPARSPFRQATPRAGALENPRLHPERSVRRPFRNLFIPGAATMLDLRKISFGGTAAVVTSMGLIVGSAATSAPEATLVGSLLIVALADNLTDALGVHIYQEAERMPQREALRTTAANFVARLCTALTFVLIVLAAPSLAVPLSLGWGVVLLGGLSYLIARRRGVSPVSEIAKHLGTAAVVIAASKLIGAWVDSIPTGHLAN